MSPILLSSASMLFLAGAYLAVGRTARARADRLRAGADGEGRIAGIIGKAEVPGRIDGLMVEARPGQTAMIDHVVLGSGRFVVVETKNWNGLVQGGARDPEWVQTRPSGEEVRHRNPIFQAKRQARILAAASGVPVTWVVVMAGRCRPGDGGFPEGVETTGSIAGALPHLMDGALAGGQADPETVMKEWAKLLENSSRAGAARAIEKQADLIEERTARREWLGWMAMAVASACAALQMMIARGVL